MQLVINTGSTSKKYALYHGDAVTLVARFEKTQAGYECLVNTPDGQSTTDTISADTFTASLTTFLELAKERQLLSAIDAITAIGFRVVCPGSFFAAHRMIDAAYVSKLTELSEYAPLHIKPLLAEITAATAELPDTPRYGISDSAFHGTQSEAVARYSLPYQDADALDIKRFGYHGLSVQSVMSTLTQETEYTSVQKAIVCHFGGGASITALRDGKSIDTSMGFSPVGGLHMSTRVGDIDPGALLYLGERKGFSYEELRTYINTECGFRGVSEDTADMRELLIRYEAGDERAVLTLTMFAHRVKKYIGAYIALLGGLDVLVLTGTINERSAIARQLFFTGLDHFGIVVDHNKNEHIDVVAQNHGFIDALAGVAIVVIATDEMSEINAKTRAMLSHI